MKRSIVTVALLPLLVSTFAQAGIVMGGTRVIYPQGKKEVAFAVTNMEKNTPYLIQSWIENYSDQNKQPVPFVVTPPLFRLDGGQKNNLRISYMGTPLPADRESVFWLNVKNIAPTAKDRANQLQINVKSKFKIFFRPDGLKGDPSDAYKSVTFTCSGNRLTAHNPTPFFVSFYSVKAGTAEVSEPGMVFPKADTSWSVSCGGKVTWQAINDFGGVSPVTTGE